MRSKSRVRRVRDSWCCSITVRPTPTTVSTSCTCTPPRSPSAWRGTWRCSQLAKVWSSSCNPCSCGERADSLERGGSVSESESAETLMPPDEPSYRTVLGHFATGVTIITAMDGGEPIGVSANAFTSVSLDPPLVLFCASKESSTWPRIEAAGKFTVNILNEHQEDVCRVFATKGGDHLIVVGLVQELGVLGDEGPLIFYRGGYGHFDS